MCEHYDLLTRWFSMLDAACLIHAMTAARRDAGHHWLLEGAGEGQGHRL